MIAFCTQSSTISSMSHKWIKMRLCNNCSTPQQYLRGKLGEAFNKQAVASPLGLTCVKAGPMNFFSETSARATSITSTLLDQSSSKQFISLDSKNFEEQSHFKVVTKQTKNSNAVAVPEKLF